MRTRESGPLSTARAAGLHSTEVGRDGSWRSAGGGARHDPRTGESHARRHRRPRRSRRRCGAHARAPRPDLRAAGRLVRGLRSRQRARTCRTPTSSSLAAAGARRMALAAVGMGAGAALAAAAALAEHGAALRADRQRPLRCRDAPALGARRARPAAASIAGAAGVSAQRQRASPASSAKAASSRWSPRLPRTATRRCARVREHAPVASEAAAAASRPSRSRRAEPGSFKGGSTPEPVLGAPAPAGRATPGATRTRAA